MARKKTSAAEDLMDLVALLPWWVGVALALMSYLVLHSLAAATGVTGAGPGQIIGLIVRAFAGVGQYLVPFICIVGAAASAWQRSQRKELISNVAQARGADSLDNMAWREFEMLVGEAFRLQGFAVAETGGGGADGGVDLVLKKGGEKFFVQCKQWKAYKVGVDVVRALYGVIAATGATGGFVVTSGTFTGEAKAFADGLNVRLVDGDRLFGMIQQARQSLSLPADDDEHSAQAPATGSSVVPECPVCSAQMVKRLAKKGASAGSQFWGCPKFPGCRGTRPIA